MSWYSAALAALQRWRAMGELRSIQKQETTANRWKFRDMLLEAKDAHERGYRSRAIDIWNHAYTIFPNIAEGSGQALNLLILLKLFDEAEALLNRGRKRHPRQLYYLEGLAQVAYERRDLTEAIRRCAVLRKKHPRSIKGIWFEAASLRQLGRFDEAEKALSRGLRGNSGDLGLLIEYARIAELRKDWDGAMKRWTTIMDDHSHFAGAVGIANVLTELGRHDEADQLLSDVLPKWGGELSIWVGIVQVAENKGDWEEVARRWSTVRKRFPTDPMVYVRSLGPILKTAGRERAEEVLREGIEYIPDDPSLMIEYALLAHRGGEWTEAARRWAALRERFPRNPEGYEKGAEALAASGDTEEAAKVRAMEPGLP